MTEHITKSPHHHITTCCVILARAGSKGLPGKNAADLCGRPMAAYTLDHALAAERIDRVVVSTDDPAVARIAAERSVEVIDRPADLADDAATVDGAVRHAVSQVEARHGETVDAVVVLYANVPLRPLDLIDRAVAMLADTGCDSVQSVSPTGKTHPYWMRTVDADGRLGKWQPNNICRRQDLPPVFMLNGGIIAVTRASLFTVREDNPHAFLGDDARAIVTPADAVVDIDTADDLRVARSLIAERTAGEADAPAVVIGDRRIGPDRPAYIIAEIGVNHDGCVERAVGLVRSAHAAGADAVKVQVFDARTLLSAEAELAAYQEGSADDVQEMLDRVELSPDDLQSVRAVARETGIDFIATCFSIELAPLLRELDVDAVKLASPDAVNAPLIDAVAALGRPLIASTGTCDLHEIAGLVRRCAAHPLALLHCVSAYPTPPEQANLRRIGAIAAMFARPTGYSDHTQDPITGALAVAHGACVIEKHLTWNRDAVGPDHAASFDPTQFATYVRRIRAAEAMSAGDPGSVQDAEREVRRVSRQSVCVVRDLPAGHVLARDDLTVKRPGTGIPAARFDGCVGRRLSCAVAANHLLRDEHLEPVDSDTRSHDAA